MKNIKDIVNQFSIDGTFVAYIGFGCGHINDTYCLTFKNNGKTERYVLQRVNNNVFGDVDKLMSNIARVTRFLKDKLESMGRDTERGCLSLVFTHDKKTYYKDDKGFYWRVTKMIEDTEAYQVAVDPHLFELAGQAFGEFIGMLEDYPAEDLYEVIPDFHNTRVRMDTFKAILKENAVKRRRYCRSEVRFVLEREEMCGRIVDLLARGDIPVRVTHNDTKINNILMDEHSGEPVCVIDLDTIMPGSLLYDFGDGIRSGCNTGAEDEKDLDKVSFDMEMFKAFATGFIHGVGDSLTEIEKKNLAFSAILITFECGMRFLTDYLNGDTYFKCAYSNHNLVRARTQFKLVEEMENRLDEMNRIIAEIK